MNVERSLSVIDKKEMEVMYCRSGMCQKTITKGLVIQKNHD